MKIKTKTNYLLGFLLSTFLIIGIINVTNGITIDTNPNISKLHTPSLFSLILGDTNPAKMNISATGSGNLDILSGLIVGINHTVSGSSILSVIGGGSQNQISASYAGIGGGIRNKIFGEGGAIGGGNGNQIIGPFGIIGGGSGNTTDNGIILGGYKNSSTENGIILGGSNNNAQNHSIALGQNAKGDNYSFAWNGQATGFSARINASGGMLIGTYTSISGVSLVVSGAIKIGRTFDLTRDGKINTSDKVYYYEHCVGQGGFECDLNGDGTGNTADEVALYNFINIKHVGGTSIKKGGIDINGSGCIQFYDGNIYNTLGKASENNDYCGINTGCQFGAITLHNGDIATGYSVSYTGNCQNASGLVICTNGKIVDKNGNGISNIYVYPYCYNLSSDPTTVISGGYQECRKGLPDNAEWTNQYFHQTLNGNTYSSQPDVQFDPSGEKDCAYKCKDGYDPINNKCVAKCTGDEPANNNRVIKSTDYPPEPREWYYITGANSSDLLACQWTCKSGFEQDGNSCKRTTECTDGYTSDGASCKTDIECQEGYEYDNDSNQCLLIGTCKNEWNHFYSQDHTINPSTGFFKIDFNGSLKTPGYNRYMPLGGSQNNLKWTCVSREEVNPHSCQFACDDNYECGYYREGLFVDNLYYQTKIATCVPEVRCYGDYSYVEVTQGKYNTIVRDGGRNGTVYKNPTQKIDKTQHGENNRFQYVSESQLNNLKASHATGCYVACDKKAHPTPSNRLGAGLYESVEGPGQYLNTNKAGYCVNNCTDAGVYNGGSGYRGKGGWTGNNERRTRRYVNQQDFKIKTQSDTGSFENSCIWTCNNSTSIPIYVKKNKSSGTVTIIDENLKQEITDPNVKAQFNDDPSYGYSALLICRHQCPNGQIFNFACKNPNPGYKIDYSSYIIYGSGQDGNDIKNYTKQYIPECESGSSFDERHGSCKSNSYQEEVACKEKKRHYRVDGAGCFVCSKGFYYNEETKICTDCDNLPTGTNDEKCVK